MLLKTPPRRRLSISLTPLIDVVFILLVFFMLASQFADWKAYELPTLSVDTTATSAVESESLSAVIRLTNDGNILLNDQPLLALPNAGGFSVIADKLAVELQRIEAGANPSELPLNITISSDSQVKLQRNIDMLDVLQTMGYQAVTFRPESELSGDTQ